jgi:hypothetical protein
MKATIDIPDALYRRVKAKSALQGRRVREVTIDLYQRWLASRDEPPEQAGQEKEDWLSAWLAHSIPKERSGPTAREIVTAGRDRLHRDKRADR